MSAPVDFSTGAPAAQKGCAAGSLTLKGKPSGAERATAPAPVAQWQQAGLTRFGRVSTGEQREGGFEGTPTDPKISSPSQRKDRP